MQCISDRKKELLYKVEELSDVDLNDDVIVDDDVELISRDVKNKHKSLLIKDF
jgi:hypothetical protein